MTVRRHAGDNPSEIQLLVCPNCGQPLPVRPPCACGFVLREIKGVLQMMRETELAEVQPFLELYRRIRSAEGWGQDDLNLPFEPLRHHAIWDIRQRTFQAFERLAARMPRGIALDVGAGNCWLTRYLDRWGFAAFAVDINTSAEDGLEAGQHYIDQGSRFVRACAGMERLPFTSGRVTLLATNGSFHYARDFRAALSEFSRVLTPGGTIVILDTPFYDNAVDGERMMAERSEELRRKYGVSAELAVRARYLTETVLREASESVALSFRLERVWPGLRRKYQMIRSGLAGRRIAEFPLVILEKRP